MRVGLWLFILTFCFLALGEGTPTPTPTPDPATKEHKQIDAELLGPPKDLGPELPADALSKAREKLDALIKAGLSNAKVDDKELVKLIAEFGVQRINDLSPILDLAASDEKKWSPLREALAKSILSTPELYEEWAKIKPGESREALKARLEAWAPVFAKLPADKLDPYQKEKLPVIKTLLDKRIQDIVAFDPGKLIPVQGASYNSSYPKTVEGKKVTMIEPANYVSLPGPANRRFAIVCGGGECTNDALKGLGQQTELAGSIVRRPKNMKEIREALAEAARMKATGKIDSLVMFGHGAGGPDKEDGEEKGFYLGEGQWINELTAAEFAAPLKDSRLPMTLWACRQGKCPKTNQKVADVTKAPVVANDKFLLNTDTTMSNLIGSNWSISYPSEIKQTEAKKDAPKVWAPKSAATLRIADRGGNGGSIPPTGLQLPPPGGNGGGFVAPPAVPPTGDPIPNLVANPTPVAPPVSPPVAPPTPQFASVANLGSGDNGGHNRGDSQTGTEQKTASSKAKGYGGGGSGSGGGGGGGSSGGSGGGVSIAVSGSNIGGANFGGMLAGMASGSPGMGNLEGVAKGLSSAPSARPAPTEKPIPKKAEVSSLLTTLQKVLSVH